MADDKQPMPADGGGTQMSKADVIGELASRRGGAVDTASPVAILSQPARRRGRRRQAIRPQVIFC